MRPACAGRIAGQALKPAGPSDADLIGVIAALAAAIVLVFVASAAVGLGAYLRVLRRACSPARFVALAFAYLGCWFTAASFARLAEPLPRTLHAAFPMVALRPEQDRAPPTSGVCGGCARMRARMAAPSPDRRSGGMREGGATMRAPA